MLSTVNVNPTDWATQLQTTVEGALSANPNILLYLPVFDSMAEFIAPAIEAAGKDGQVHVASFNGTPAILTSIRTGNIVTMDVGENTSDVAAAGLDQIMRVMLHKPAGQDVINVRIMDKSNVSQAGVPAVSGRATAMPLLPAMPRHGCLPEHSRRLNSPGVPGRPGFPDGRAPPGPGQRGPGARPDVPDVPSVAQERMRKAVQAMTEGAAAGTTNAAAGTNTAATVERAADILLLFANSSAPQLGVTKIANMLSMSKSAVHRVLLAFRGKNLLEFDPVSRKYALGPACLGLGPKYLGTLDIRKVAADELVSLSRETNGRPPFRCGLVTGGSTSIRSLPTGKC